MFDTPFALSHSTTHCKSGFPPTLTRPLGKSAVMGLSRIPSPPDRTTAVVGQPVSLCNTLVEHQCVTHWVKAFHAEDSRAIIAPVKERVEILVFPHPSFFRFSKLGCFDFLDLGQEKCGSRIVSNLSNNSGLRYSVGILSLGSGMPITGG